MDFKDCKINVTVRALVLYEKLHKKPYNDCSTDEDMRYLMYAALIANNDITITYNVFETMLHNRKYMQWLLSAYQKIGDFQTQFTVVDETKEDDAKVWMSEIASTLIIHYGLEPSYVYDKMQLYEIGDYFKAIDQKRKDTYEEKRLWCYMQLSPYLPKKIKTPSDLMPFPWEEDERKKKAEEDLNKNENWLKELFNKNE